MFGFKFMFGLFGALRLYENRYNNNSYTVIKSLRNIPTYLYNIEKFAKNVIVFSGKAAKYNVAKPVDFHF